MGFKKLDKMDSGSGLNGVEFQKLYIGINGPADIYVYQPYCLVNRSNMCVYGHPAS